MKCEEQKERNVVMQNREIQKEMLERLAKVEGLVDLPGIICDKHCKYPYISRSQEELDSFCERCELQGLLQALVLAG